ncbi:MAG: ATP-dependent RNA helicase [Thermoanaerobaculia bacterium]
MVQTPLPIDSHVSEIVAHVRSERTAVIVAPPGAGKTTRIPPALAAIGRTILLQPRRVAARALTRRIAAEQEWTIGDEIGWQIRFERRFSKHTRLLVATEGILTARLQSDPLLSDFDIVVLDEFHERSIYADLALAMVRQAAMSRDDLAVVVMSATLDAQPIADFLGDAKILRIDAQRYPVDVQYRAGLTMSQAVREILPAARGDILAFLPGAREIERARSDLAGVDALVLPLHGSLDVDEQERALTPADRRKVILSTNIAETSLTVEGVTDVIDSGLHKILRYDAETAIDHLVLERIASDSAEQRSGRAGRIAPGSALRLWDKRDMLRAHGDAEVHRVDLSSTALDIIAWGGDPMTFEWFDRPQDDRLAAALELLRRLGAIDGRRLTTIGDQMRELPLHPRLARLLIAAGGSREAIELCARLAEGRRSADLSHVRELTAITHRAIRNDGVDLQRAVLAGYPDRVAMRRGEGLLLATGTGGRFAPNADPGGEFVVALDIRNAIVAEAVKIERDWLEPTKREVVHELHERRVRAFQRVWYDSLLLREQPVPVDPGEAAPMLAGIVEIDPELKRRGEFAGIEITATALTHGLKQKLDKLAPATIPLPSGRTARLQYREDGSIVAEVKLQELFGLAETPRIGPKQTPVTFALLAPNGRPVQVTRDLRSFWTNTYAEVRKELRGRYPKHPWPEDPWTAQPTHRTKRK